MTSDSQKIREVLDLLETNAAPQQETLMEGWASNLKSKIHRRLGDNERKKLASMLKKEWSTWLGQTRRVGAMDDMMRFMTQRIGFNQSDIEEILPQTASKAEPEVPAEEPKAAPKPQAKKPISSPAQPAKDPNEPFKVRGADKDEYRRGEEWNAEDGIPMPKDLNAKMSDYGPVGDAARKAKKSNESIVEADTTDNSAPLDPSEVDHILDMAAAQINDNYLYNGPENDKANAGGTPSQSGTQASYQDRGKMSSGQYDPKEMYAILSQELEISKQKLSTITSYVQQHADKGYTRMQRDDIDVLARIGYAFLRART